MDSNSTRYDFTNTLNLVSSFLMAANGIFGVICNLSILYIFICVPTERSSFNLICVYRSIGNTIILVWGFMATFIPIGLKETSPFSNNYETVVILSCNNIYMIIQYSGMIIASNRFCAMFFPIMYHKLFNIKITCAFLSIVFLFKLADNIYYLVTFLPRDCYTLYSSFYLAWIPNMNPNCHSSQDIPNPFNNTAILVVLLILMNIATFSKIYFFYKSTESEQREMKRKTKKNKTLFFQTLFQDGVMLIDMLFTFKLSQLSNERYWTFISGTFVWQCVHSVDGFLMVMFNERLSFLKKRLFGIDEKSHTTIQVLTTVHH
ncbi:hypothetical protein GCK72_018064 [Caenorhabditis remanei]|uniref:7TM GPCR serpentine receptor class x (Srx) domain-containing protein n=1 Tax=Caenorhabditis remanei TaxID=31234 RepID=A0A6A5G941_CAERE|nr:hypothetical protein GCK72_018064 [Caenorhabditis remanei]KAF1751510.1 hypothetical protein GCK72_018064 [Caenorhabditis remanei]